MADSTGARWLLRWALFATLVSAAVGGTAYLADVGPVSATIAAAAAILLPTLGALAVEGEPLRRRVVAAALCAAVSLLVVLVIATIAVSDLDLTAID